MKIKQILNIERTGENRPPHLSQLDQELLLALTLKTDRNFVLMNPDFELSVNQAKRYSSLLKKRLNNYPFAYLNGQQEFYGLNFLVNLNTLIPRPETEFMIDFARENFLKTDLNIIDLGTGSGCIIISLARNLKGNNKYFALDISAPALKTAKLNAKLNGLASRIRFVKSDLLSAWLIELRRSPNRADKFNFDPKLPLLICANLPYLSPEQIAAAPSIKHEPRRALEAGYDGLKYYKRLLPQIRELQSAGWPEINFILEIDPGQNEKLSRLIISTFGAELKSLKTKTDLSGQNRFLVAALG